MIKKHSQESVSVPVRERERELLNMRISFEIERHYGVVCHGDCLCMNVCTIECARGRKESDQKRESLSVLREKERVCEREKSTC